MAEVSVQIGADIKELQAKLPRALKLLDKLKQEQKDLTKAFANGQITSDKYYSKLAANSTRLGKISKYTRDVKSALTDSAKGFDKLGKSSANAAPTLQEFSRVIQDAPYGIQGVGNNITQLTSQFGYLSKKVGGTVPALKLLASSFTGPAGILFAISTVVSILTVYGDELLKSTSATGGLAKATAKYLGEAKSEITTLSTLVKIAKDEANSKEVRQKALEEINKNYSKYLGNLDLESLKTDTVTASVKKLTEALILKAKVAGLDALITEKTADKSEDIVEADLKREKALKVLNSEVNKAIKGNSYFNRLIGDVSGARARLQAFSDLTKRQDDVGAAARKASAGINVSLQAYTDASKEAKSLNKELDDSLSPLIRLQEQFKKGLYESEGNIGNVDDGVVLITTSLKKQEEAREKAGKKRLSDAEKLASDIKKFNDKFAAEQIADEQKKIDEIIKLGNNITSNIDPFDGDIISINNGFSQILEVESKIKDLQKLLSSLHVGDINLEGLSLDQLNSFDNRLQSSLATANIFSEAAGNSFKALSSQIATSMQTGNAIVDAFTSSIISSLAQMAAAGLQGLIVDQVIASAKNNINRGISSGNAITIATSAAAAAGPLGVPLLPGLIASQLALVNGAFAGVGAFAKGSGGFSGDNNLAMLNRNEMILRPMEQSALYNAIRGHNLGSLSSNTIGNNNTSTDITINGVMRGQNQILQAKRANKKYNRFFS